MSGLQLLQLLLQCVEFLYCIDIVGWLMEGHLAYIIPVTLIPRGPVPEQVKEEI